MKENLPFHEYIGPGDAGILCGAVLGLLTGIVILLFGILSVLKDSTDEIAQKLDKISHQIEQLQANKTK